MKNLCLTIAIVFGLMLPMLGGCGGKGQNEVIQVDPNEGGLGQADQEKYAEEMRNRKERGN